MGDERVTISHEQFQHYADAGYTRIPVVRERIDNSGRKIRLEIDGGVKPDNIAEIAAAGADTFVAGSAIFGQKDYADVVSRMKQAVAGVR